MERAAPGAAVTVRVPTRWAPKVKLGKKKTFYIIGTAKKIVFTKLRGRGDSRAFYIAEAYVRSPVPWDSTVYGPAALDNLSGPQIAACEALYDASKRLAGINRIQRKALLARALRVGARGRGGVVVKKPRAPRLSPEEYARRIAA